MEQGTGSALEMSYLRGAYSVTRWEVEGNESEYDEICGMGTHAVGEKCSLVEWMKRNT